MVRSCRSFRTRRRQGRRGAADGRAICRAPVVSRTLLGGRLGLLGRRSGAPRRWPCWPGLLRRGNCLLGSHCPVGLAGWLRVVSGGRARGLAVLAGRPDLGRSSGAIVGHGGRRGLLGRSGGLAERGGSLLG